jgi:DNA-directed RNA polymerase subunit RPC12/RpoP
MSHLRLVPPKTLSLVEQVRERVKAMPRPEGMCQCPQCGGRTSLTMRNGTRIKNGRLIPGTLIEHYICADCWKIHGLKISILPPSIKPA